ncbi:hypothetical protein J8J40_29425, partial [Mycobacterium tuberculosis]|nr:hypothetical protein [Mycobacterium tuberculosis]
MAQDLFGALPKATPAATAAPAVAPTPKPAASVTSIAAKRPPMKPQGMPGESDYNASHIEV